MKTSDALKLALQGVKKYVDNSINTNSIVRPYEIFRVDETIFGKTGYIDVETMEPSVKYGLAEEYLDCSSFAFVIPTATTPYAIMCISASFQVSDLMVTEKWEGDPSKGEEGLYIIVRGLNEDYKINIRHKESKDGVTIEIIRNTRYLNINNTKEFIPTDDYNPATKKYVDDAMSLGNYASIDSPEFTTAISLHRKTDSTVGNYSSAFGSDVTASADYSHAEGVATIASGIASHAEGASSKAIGNGAHAEGGACEANGNYSHAEGYYTKAGEYSHAEGYLAEATGTYSHAEGYQTKATVGYSHAEGGNTEASNQYTHAEGRSTKAMGMSSHSEGHQTIAKGENQHVQGKFNIEDTENKYAHIVGNGDNNSNRANAHTLDWEGNAWFAGKVRVGASNERLATTTELIGAKGSGSKAEIFNYSNNT